MRAVLVLALVGTPALAQVQQGPPNAPYQPAWPTQTRAPALPSTEVATETFATGLDFAWGISALPDGTFLVTEKPHGLRLIQADGTVGELISGVPQADVRDQGGWLDVAAAPDFATSRLVYWTYAKPEANETTATAAARGRLSEDGTTMTDVVDVFVQEPPSAHPKHYGSRIVFDDAGHMFITTGEHFETEDRVKAQDLHAQYGKVIRLNLDGSAPDDNPWPADEAAPGVFNYGHRNVQGAAFAPDGTLWTLEHGPMGGDELQPSRPGVNYGWPEVSYGLNYDGSPVGTGEPRGDGFEEPTYYWDPVIAPSGMIFYAGDAFPDWAGDALIASLKPGGLVRIKLGADGKVEGEERMLPDLGRVRDVEELPDGSLLLLLDKAGGDIVHVTPKAAA